jgi:adenine deaminase
MLKRLALLFVVCAAAAPSIVVRSGSVAPEYDTAIINGRIVDGTGNPWFFGSVAVKDDRIVKVGLVDPHGATKVIDAKGMASRASSVTSCLPSPSG